MLRGVPPDDYDEARDPLGPIRVATELVGLAFSFYLAWVLVPESVKIELRAQLARLRRALEVAQGPSVVGEAMGVIADSEAGLDVERGIGDHGRA